MSTIYNLTKDEAKTLLSNFNNDVEVLATVLYNKGITKSLDSGIKRAIKIKKFANI
jgi:hypothetical protein